MFSTVRALIPRGDTGRDARKREPRLSSLVLAAFLGLLAVVPNGIAAPAPGQTFRGAAFVDPTLGISPIERRIVVRPAGTLAVACGRTFVRSDGRYEVVVDPATAKACDDELWFWLEPRSGRPSPFAETARITGTRDRRLDLHLWAPMRISGDVLSTEDLEGAGLIVCTPDCRSRKRVVCGGSAIFEQAFAAMVLPRTPLLRCPEHRGRFGFAVVNAKGRLLRAEARGVFLSGSQGHFDVVAGFSRQNTLPATVAGPPRKAPRGATLRVDMLTYLARSQPGLSFWAEVDGPPGTGIRSLFASDPLPESHPLHNTWRCLLRGPAPDQSESIASRSAHCTGFIGRPPPGRYVFQVELRTPPHPGVVTLRLYAIGGDEHAFALRRIRVR